MKVKAIKLRNPLKQANGFIDREGNFYKCDYQQHYYFAEYLFPLLNGQIHLPHQNHQRALELAGWVKLSNGHFFYQAPIGFLMTEIQLETILAYHRKSTATRLGYNGRYWYEQEFLDELREMEEWAQMKARKQHG